MRMRVSENLAPPIGMSDHAPQAFGTDIKCSLTEIAESSPIINCTSDCVWGGGGGGGGGLAESSPIINCTSD